MKRILLETIANLGGIPFFLATTSGKFVLNYARIIEAFLIAGVTGIIAAYMTVGEIKIKLAYMESCVARMNTSVDQMQRDVVRIDTLQQERLQRERTAK